MRFEVFWDKITNKEAREIVGKRLDEKMIDYSKIMSGGINPNQFTAREMWLIDKLCRDRASIASLLVDFHWHTLFKKDYLRDDKSN